ncbi:hypothetical protein K438DRAFT_1664421 [Mycena galopus ATCC 62051]|nr:hypothetical protein K438DRAFT_1664421 [Mycena galopus ATCC 62051]
MNTFCAFRFAARTLLHPSRHAAPHFASFNPTVLHPRAHVRFKHKYSLIRLRDDKIPYEEVSLVQEDNVLVKTSLKRLLSSIDRSKQWVELVAVTPEPVVKIVLKKVAVEIEKKLRVKQRQAARKNSVKEVQLTWGSETGDLDHKVARIRSYLEIGAKVDIVFSTKPKVTPPLVTVQQEKVQEMIGRLADISKQLREVDWRKDMAAIFLQGIVNPDKLTPEQMGLVEEEGVEEMESVANAEAEGALEAAPQPPAPAPPPPPSRPSSQPVDLSEFGFVPPPQRRNPLKGMKDPTKKKYGTRKFGMDKPGS